MTITHVNAVVNFVSMLGFTDGEVTVHLLIYTGSDNLTMTQVEDIAITPPYLPTTPIFEPRTLSQDISVSVSQGERMMFGFGATSTNGDPIFYGSGDISVLYEL
jgi:hypothetical protein